MAACRGRRSKVPVNEVAGPLFDMLRAGDAAGGAQDVLQWLISRDMCSDRGMPLSWTIAAVTAPTAAGAGRSTHQ